MKDALIVAFGVALLCSIIFVIIVGGADFMWNFQIDHIGLIRTGCFLTFAITFIGTFIDYIGDDKNDPDKA